MSVRALDELLAGNGVQGARVFVRSDLNVPLKDGAITDDTRIRASLPTLRRLLDAGARVVLCSHLGRPKGERKPELSLAPVAKRLGELLSQQVHFCDQTVGPEAERAAEALAPGELLLLENVRFDARETQNDPEFAKALAALADAYVNDAFGTAHRAHASTAGITEHVGRVAAGDLLQKELDHLGAVLEPERPLLCLLGGAKVSDKLAVLEALAPHADVLCVGGAMAYTFMVARGESVGTSMVEPDRVDEAKKVLDSAAAAGRKLLLPTDHVVADRFADDAEIRVVRQIPDGFMALDIGPETAAAYAAEARAAKTVLWNGPMGVFEMEPFAGGTKAVAQAVAESSANTVVGGGDSLAAINQLGLGARIDHLSTGGGASLEFVQGIELPGVKALDR